MNLYLEKTSPSRCDVISGLHPRWLTDLTKRKANVGAQAEVHMEVSTKAQWVQRRSYTRKSTLKGTLPMDQHKRKSRTDPADSWRTSLLLPFLTPLASLEGPPVSSYCFGLSGATAALGTNTSWNWMSLSLGHFALKSLVYLISRSDTPTS